MLLPSIRLPTLMPSVMREQTDTNSGCILPQWHDG
jgi:hypothetical protein